MLIEFVRWGGKLICCCCSIAKKIFYRVKASHPSLGHLFFNLDTEKNVKCCEKCQKVWSVLDIWAWEMKTLLQETIATRYRFSYWRRKDDIVEKVTQHKSLLKLGQLNPWGVCLEKKVKKYTTLGEYSFFPNQVTDVMSTLGCKSH